MKNNFITYLLSIFIFFICHNILWANEFTFDALEINISDKGNIINATDGTATTKEGNIIIRAKEFEYNKFLSILDAYDGVATLIEKNITIKANKFIYNREKFLIEANGEVEIKDLTKKILIKS